MCSPPPREAADQDALWQALALGDLQTISSDHAPYGFDATGKLSAGPNPSFKQIANGLPGLEVRMPLLFDAMVSKGRLGLHKFVELTATAPAKIYNLSPTKGSIAIGADADIALWNPNQGDALRRHDARSHGLYAVCRPAVRGWPTLFCVGARSSPRTGAARQAWLRPVPATGRRRSGEAFRSHQRRYGARPASRWPICLNGRTLPQFRRVSRHQARRPLVAGRKTAQQIIDFADGCCRELDPRRALRHGTNGTALVQNVFPHREAESRLLLIPQQWQMRVKQIVGRVAFVLALQANDIRQHVWESIAGIGAIGSSLRLKVDEQPAVAGQYRDCRIEPSRSNPRTALIFSRPGQSSCFNILQLACACTIRRMTDGAITTPLASG